MGEVSRGEEVSGLQPRLERYTVRVRVKSRASFECFWPAHRDQRTRDGEIALIVYVRIAYRELKDRKEEASPYKGFSPEEIVFGFSVLGGIFAGGAAGFLLRPSVPLVGQIPFSIVISRGADLHGIDLNPEIGG